MLGPTEYTDDLGQKQSGKLTVQGVYMIWKKFYSMEAQILCMPGWRGGGGGGAVRWVTPLSTLVMKDQSRI